jgi:hypothetical protein
MNAGTVTVSKVLRQAVAGDPQAVMSLFSGFLTEAEELRGCGYLGSLGFIFPEYSFWCVTDERASSLRIKRSGEVVFSSGYLAQINSEAFYQPSLTRLWITIGVLGVVTFGMALLFTPLMVRAFYQINKSGVVFWVREGIPVYIFANRDYLRSAQAVSVLIAEGRRHA